MTVFVSGVSGLLLGGVAMPASSSTGIRNASTVRCFPHTIEASPPPRARPSLVNSRPARRSQMPLVLMIHAMRFKRSERLPCEIPRFLTAGGTDYELIGCVTGLGRKPGGVKWRGDRGREMMS